MHDCETFHEEQADKRWEEIKEEIGHIEPACGHAIHYLCSGAGVEFTMSTAESYASTLLIFVDFLHKRNSNVCDASLKELNEFFHWRVRQNRSEGTLSADRVALNNLYKHIALYRDANPNLSRDLILEEIDPSVYQTAEIPDRKPLTLELLSKFISATETPREKLITEIALRLGPRNSTICIIKISDINFGEKQLS